jgi:hypothetical protein
MAHPAWFCVFQVLLVTFYGCRQTYTVASVSIGPTPYVGMTDVTAWRILAVGDIYMKIGSSVSLFRVAYLQNPLSKLEWSTELGLPVWESCPAL